MRELQFRESCDAVRTKQSQQRHRGVVLDQKAQARYQIFSRGIEKDGLQKKSAQRYAIFVKGLGP